DANPWIGIPGRAVDIGVAADGTVWHVNSAGGIFRYTGDQGSTDWVGVAGGLTRISVGSRTHVWGVNSLGQIYRYTGHDANPWIGIPGRAVDIGVAADGTV
ncbi:tectonin domain-containing protein, partial [Streptomyces resistomycificus]